MQTLQVQLPDFVPIDTQELSLLLAAKLYSNKGDAIKGTQ